MGTYKYGPGGGAVPCRPDEKIASERQIITYSGYKFNPRHQKSWRRSLKKAMTKKRRQRNKVTDYSEITHKNKEEKT